MSITCTYGDLDRLRDAPSRQGPLTKLMSATEPSLVDKFRIVRLAKEVDHELETYGKFLVELGKKYGDPVKINGKPSWQIRPDEQENYLAEKAKIDADPCELLVSPLPASSYEKVPLTATDLMLLGPFIVTPPENP